MSYFQSISAFIILKFLFKEGEIKIGIDIICLILQLMRLRFYISFILFFILKVGFCGNNLDKPDFESWEINSNPYNVIYNQQYYLQKEDYNPEKSGKSFEGGSNAQRKTNSIKFKQLLDGKGILIDFKSISRDPDHIDSISLKNVYFIEGLNRKVWVEKQGNKWLISKEAQKNIVKLHQEVYPFGSDFILNLMPYKGGDYILGLKIWQWTGLLILLFFSFLLYRLCTSLFKFLIRKIGDWQVGKNVLLPRYILRFSQAFSISVSFWLLKLFVPALNLNSKISLYIIKGLDVFLSFFVLLTLWRGFVLVMNYFDEKSKQTSDTFDNQMVNAVKKMGKLLFIFATMVLSFRKLGVELSTILAGLSIGGLAIALAAQDVIKNLIGSINILVDRPFRIGDFIEADNKQIVGMVEEVGLRSTRIRTPKDTIISTPNGKLAEMTINNLGLKVYRIFRMEVNFGFDCSIEKIEEMVVMAKEKLKEGYILKANSMEGYISEVSSRGVTVSFSFFFKVPKGSKEILQKHEFFKIILELCQQLNIQPLIGE